MPQTDFASSIAAWGPNSSRRQPTLAEAQAYCRQFATSHYENFTVVSWLLPATLRQHFCNVYAYCRWADDLADEPPDAATSAQLLDWWEAQLLASYHEPPTHPVFVALTETIRTFEIPAEPFLNLLSAFRQDQVVTRYADHEQALDYCRRSADPVGRILLALGRVNDAESVRLSDSVCTGLQLANFCQDVARDWQRGRVYLPQDALAAVGYTEADFQRSEFNAAFRQVMQQEVDRAERYLLAGKQLVPQLPHELQFDVSLFAAGGLAILDAIRRQDFNVWARRPTLSKFDKLRIALRCWWHGGVA